MSGIEKEVAKFWANRVRAKLRQKQSGGLLFRRGLRLPLRATTRELT